MGNISKQCNGTKIVMGAALLCIAVAARGQDLYFIGEGKNNEVKLFWLPEAWADSLRGYHILRRPMGENHTAWERLTDYPITPGNTVVKSLTNVTNNNNEIQRLMARRNHLLHTTSGNRLGVISRSEFIRAFQTSHEIDMLSLMFSLDFDISLLCGFGYHDMNIPYQEKYEYGIQEVYRKSLSEVKGKFHWVYGEENNIDVKIKPVVKKKRNRMKIAWTIQTDVFKNNKRWNGFHLYRIENATDTVKLNAAKIMVNTSETQMKIVYSDSIISDSSVYRYAIAPVNIFNNEGSWFIADAPVDNFPEKIPPPSLERVINKSNANDEMLHFKWTFSAINEQWVSGFLLQRKAGNGKYITISDTLHAHVRRFKDNPGIKLRGKQLVYRLIAVRNYSFPVWSNPYPLVYRPRQSLTAPSGIEAELREANGSYHIHLSWNQANSADTITAGYALFTDHGGSYFGREANLQPIQKEFFNYKVDKNNGARYRFAIAAVDRYQNTSKMSDTLTVLTPTITLPVMNVWPVQQNAGKVTLNWNYPADIPDLAGFRIYMNNQLIADESSVGPDTNSWTSSELQPGKYTFQMTAVSAFNITSRNSKPRVFVIDDPNE